MGLIAGYLAFKGEASQPWRLFLMTGSLAATRPSRRFRWMPRCSMSAAKSGLRLYVVGSVVLSIAGLFAGLALVRHLT